MRDEALRRALREALRGRGAHVDTSAALDGLAADLRARRPTTLPYGVWDLLEHLRLSTEDIVFYALDPAYASPPWPDGYWPEPVDDVDDASWNTSRAALEEALATLRGWVDDPDFDLTREIAHSDEVPGLGKRTYLRQVLVAVDHVAYHTGQIVLVRRALDAW